MQAILPYEKTAEFYDYLLGHVNYDEWAQYINEITNIFEIPDKTLLDIACGTGSFLKEINQIGFDCTGIELSESMVNQAQIKNKCLNIQIADMLTYISPQKKSIITCLFDSINYLDQIELLKDLCNTTYENLTSDGLFIFDCVTESHCLTHYFDYTEYDSYKLIDYQRRCQFDIQSKIQRSTFIINDHAAEYVEVHNQYIYDHQLILDTINESKLSFEAAYADFTFEKPNKKTERIHYVCRKQL